MNTLARIAAMAVLSSCAHPIVLSPYGSMIGVSSYPGEGLESRDRPHDGVDIRADGVGDPVIASADGVVAYVMFWKNVGYEIRIVHAAFGRYTTYLHLASSNVKAGDDVHRGDVIGTVGLFSASEGVVHVHWSLCTNPQCSGPKWLDGTEDPEPLTVGCFRDDVAYPTDHLVLTYPVRC